MLTCLLITQFVSGQYDLIFCGSNCTGIVNGPLTPLAYPKTRKLGIHIQPNSGHGLNLHYNASAWYKVANDFLGSNGL